MESKQIAGRIVALLGGAENIVSLTNCMTRLHVRVRSGSLVDEDGLRGLPEVFALVCDGSCRYEVVVGPGKSYEYADLIHRMGVSSAAEGPLAGDGGAAGRPPEAPVASPSNPRAKVRGALKALGEIFVPLIPGIITAGLCAGLASLLAQLVPDYQDIPAWNLAWQMLTLVNASFISFITAWAGYRAAERFGATPILGGMLGMVTCLAQINEVSKILGLYNVDAPLSSVLLAGKGGVLAAVFGVLVLARVEKLIRKRMPSALDVVFSPLLTLLACVVPYVLVIMPLFGFVSSGVAWALGQASMSGYLAVRVAVGYVAAAVFLPLVACGMHHGMVALYAVQLQELGRVTLYPALAMAGAGQVGAAIALYVKACRLGHGKLRSVIGGALPAGFLGVGEPLVYGVTLPMGRPFITAGLGAGFGGAFVTACQVASTAWGPSGLLGVFVMTAGEGGAVNSVAMYLAGICISYVMGFAITMLAIKDDEVARALGGVGDEGPRDAGREAEPVAAGGRAGAPHAGDGESPGAASGTGRSLSAAGQGLRAMSRGGSSTSASGATGPAHRLVSHGDPVPLGEPRLIVFRHVVTDPVGLHARPAGELARIASSFGAEVVVRCDGRAARASSVSELMLLDVPEGAELEFTAEGKDARKAADSIRRYLESNV